jgi:hypothetical protein
LAQRKYEHSWEQLSLASLASNVRATSGWPSDPELYAGFYTQLAKGCGGPTQGCVEDKIALGAAISSQVFQLWERKYGRRPRVLALAVGNGMTEAVWLDQGYDVTLHECQAVSLKDLCHRFPHAPTFIADLRGAIIPGTFDIVAMVAADYAFTSEELTGLMRSVRASLGSHGWMVMHSMSILSVTRWVKEKLRRVPGGYPSSDHVFWGWWRTPGELAGIAAAAGLEVAHVYRKMSPRGGKLLRPRWWRLAPVWSRESMLMVLSRDRQPRS